MVKGFEHLSDAQLEHYGTGNFAVISDDAQRIEAHLEECADCRSRILEHQRARLGFMAHDSMKASLPTPDCVSEDDLRNLAAGIATLEKDKAASMTRHVAECPHCAYILRTFTEDFSDDPTPEDTATLSKLKSGSAQWQKRLIQKLFPPK